jgi:hypothetical protein
MKLQNKLHKLLLDGRSLKQDRAFNAIYGLALALSISTWFIAVRAPLWLDETCSYWQIVAGFSKIMSRQIVFFPAYSYILWFSTKIIGSSEIALRVPSILAMFGAVYLLYLAARELFDRDVSLIATIIFCLHPIVVFAAIDVRSYAFAALATNVSILIVFRLRHNDSNWLAALFGLSAAWIVWFHYLFATILPALVLCFFVIKAGDRKTLWRQFGVAMVAFALAFLPVIPRLLYLFRTSGSHVFETAPSVMAPPWTLAPGEPWVVVGLIAFAMAALAAVGGTRFSRKIHLEGWHILLCLSLALIPLLILYGVSVATSLHVFSHRYRLIAVPGISLCWAKLFSVIRPRAARSVLCLGLVAVTAYLSYNSPSSGQHLYSWKYALQAVEMSASTDKAPVLICSDLPEADYETMPLDSAKESSLFAPLSYYRLSVPVVPLPRALNDEARRVGSQFLDEAAMKHERFLAAGYESSYATLDWLAQSAAGTNSVRKLGIFDGVEVLEFVPRSLPSRPLSPANLRSSPNPRR